MPVEKIPAGGDGKVAAAPSYEWDTVASTAVMDDGGCRMNNARGVAAVMLVLGCVACGGGDDDTDAASTGASGTTVTTAESVTLAPTTEPSTTTDASGTT